MVGRQRQREIRWTRMRTSLSQRVVYVYSRGRSKQGRYRRSRYLNVGMMKAWTAPFVSVLLLAAWLGLLERPGERPSTTYGRRTLRVGLVYSDYPQALDSLPVEIPSYPTMYMIIVLVACQSLHGRLGNLFRLIVERFTGVS